MSIHLHFVGKSEHETPRPPKQEIHATRFDHKVPEMTLTLLNRSDLMHYPKNE